MNCSKKGCRVETFDPVKRDTTPELFDPITECLLLRNCDLDLDDPADDLVPDEDPNELLEDIADLCVKIRDEEDPQVKDDLAARIIEMIEVELDT